MGTAIPCGAQRRSGTLRKAVHGLCIGSPRSCRKFPPTRTATPTNDVSSPCGRLCVPLPRPPCPSRQAGRS